ncbi:MAG: electron transport complex subunit RsxG, partial [Gammaproteobacteria bacterium]|nr:electron transport complex subunit RsxG [Gammaproteobacteria bacterium]
MNYRQIVITTIILLLFALIGTALVVYTFDNTRERIAANERATLLRKLNKLITPEQHDNILLEDTLTVTGRPLLGTTGPITVYRARKAAQPVALVITPVAPDGYSGSIKLLVGINVDGTLSGVRVVAHRETPGLGDAIDETRSDWIHIFDNKSLGNPPLARWKVKKDGGDFDQLTGATITPRAVVKAVRQALLYYRDNQ